MDLGRWQRVAYHYENELGQYVLDNAVNGPDRYSAIYYDDDSRMVCLGVFSRLDQAFVILAVHREQLRAQGHKFGFYPLRPLPPKAPPGFHLGTGTNRTS